MHWTLYDLSPERQDGDPQAQDAPDSSAELEPLPDFPTLTDCPLCGSRDPQKCGCFENADLWPTEEK
ncbi:hypothetical protein D3875_03385 [Deinococcus cavernae]|uniref:Uncharacterized protein n=1 Tax=Deinococcus cavernae TaxID=2320857 RepID=A0A418VES3_9DEIO|nr:hypothetical protein [Deinococcus cavernae]RJF74597.1 hypothetical protein D3875_03385 [Deinococcus cavernae]